MRYLSYIVLGTIPKCILEKQFILQFLLHPSSITTGLNGKLRFLDWDTSLLVCHNFIHQLKNYVQLFVIIIYTLDLDLIPDNKADGSLIDLEVVNRNLEILLNIAKLRIKADVGTWTYAFLPNQFGLTQELDCFQNQICFVHSSCHILAVVQYSRVS